MRSVRIIGGGRAGSSMAVALADVGWKVRPVLHRGTPVEVVAQAANNVDLLLIATPDEHIGSVAATVTPVDTTVVAHLAGSLGLDVLKRHSRPASLHPLASLPGGAVGAQCLRSQCWFAVAGDPLMLEVVNDLNGQSFHVADSNRAAYHAAAVIASNHLVALLSQAERIAGTVGVPWPALVHLARITLENVAELGPAAALTGPAARRDEVTIRRHLKAIASEEHVAYKALAQQARQLAGHL